eukprot:scaffold747_cov120-Cylindrotheca_fusiformis.AAC.18
MCGADSLTLSVLLIIDVTTHKRTCASRDCGHSLYSSPKKFETEVLESLDIRSMTQKCNPASHQQANQTMTKNSRQKVRYEQKMVSWYHLKPSHQVGLKAKKKLAAVSIIRGRGTGGDASWKEGFSVICPFVNENFKHLESTYCGTIQSREENELTEEKKR